MVEGEPPILVAGAIQVTLEGIHKGTLVDIHGVTLVDIQVVPIIQDILINHKPQNNHAVTTDLTIPTNIFI